MIIYEVNLLVHNHILIEFKKWLNDHIKEMLKIDGFKSCEVSQEETNVLGKTQIVCHYKIKSRNHLQKYFDTLASKMRADTERRFTTHYIATRRIMEIIM